MTVTNQSGKRRSEVKRCHESLRSGGALESLKISPKIVVSAARRWAAVSAVKPEAGRILV